jgi:hypothetical protein
MVHGGITQRRSISVRLLRQPVPEREAGKRRTFWAPDPLWAESLAEAARRGESLSAAIRRFLAKQYVKGKG